MANLPGILIKIGANTTDAVQGINKVNKALGRADGAARKTRAAWKATAAAVTAGAAVFATAVAAGVDAAMDDEAELSRLNTTLGNLGFADATDEITAFIDNLQFAANVSETKLRPAFASLISATKDVKLAQDDLTLALDISQSTGIDLQGVADALAKAYAGNRKGLVGLKSGLDKAWLSSASMVEITQALTDRFGGSASAQAGTLAGSVEGVKIAFDELNESWGTGLLTGAGGGSENLAEVEQNLRNMQDSAENLGEAVGTLASGVVGGFEVIRQVTVAMTSDTIQRLNNLYDGWINIADRLNIISDAEADHERAVQSQIEADQQLMAAQDLLGYTFGGTAAAADTSTAALNAHADALGRVAGAASGAASQIVKLGDAYTAANYFGGTPTAGYDRDATVLSILKSRQKMAAQRAAARAKKKSDRINAVRLANSVADTVARAASRTGSKRATDRVQLNRRACA